MAMTIQALHDEVRKVREEVNVAFERWNGVSVVSDPTWEDFAWSEYLAKVKRYDALFKEYKERYKEEGLCLRQNARNYHYV